MHGGQHGWIISRVLQWAPIVLLKKQMAYIRFRHQKIGFFWRYSVLAMKDEIAFLKYCFKKRKDQRFVKNVMAVSNDSSLVNLEEMGGEKELGYIYHIKIRI